MRWGRVDLGVQLGPVRLPSPLIGASGTMGSIHEFADVTDLSLYGAVVAKSVSAVPWSGRPAPRVAPERVGMLNGIGIQNPGIDAWLNEHAPLFGAVPTQTWGSAVGHTVDEFVEVATKMAGAGIAVVEINLSCPNLDGHLFALDPGLCKEVVSAVRAAVDVPVGAKLSPNAAAIVDVAEACMSAGADWVVLTNTALGTGIDVHTRRPKLSGNVGGYSGHGLKPLSLRCVLEVHRELPEVPIVGCGGISTGDDVVEYVLAGASAVAVGTAHFADPKVAGRMTRQLRRRLRGLGVRSLAELRGGVELW